MSGIEKSDDVDLKAVSETKDLICFDWLFKFKLMETETLLIKSVDVLKMEQSNHQKTRDRLAEVARKYLST